MTKHLRVTIEVQVNVMDLTLERVLQRQAERLRSTESHDSPLPLISVSSIARQKLLFDQLNDSPVHLETFLRAEIIQELQMGGFDHVALPERDTAFFLPLVEKLPPRERHHLREVLARGEIIDHTEELFDSFDVTIGTVSITEVLPHSPGTPE